MLDVAAPPIAAKRPSRAGAPLFSAPRLLVALVASVPVASKLLDLLGPAGLVPYVALWMVATPLVVPSLTTALRREWAGALFVLSTAAAVEYLDEVLGLSQRISVGVVSLSLLYVAQRRQLAWQELKKPLLMLFALFMLQQLLSAIAFHADDVEHVATNRFSMVICVVAGAVLVRRPDGARLLPALMIIGALLSVPLMLLEVRDPALALFPSLIDTKVVSGRAAGLFVNPNDAGVGISFAAAFAIGLRRELGRAATAIVMAALLLGLLACASRGAFAIVALLAATAWLLDDVRRTGRWPLVRVGLTILTLAALSPLVQAAVPVIAGRLDRLGFENADRLAEVVGAVAGRPDELMDDDSHRLTLLEGALPHIAERPWLGWGTYQFRIVVRRGDDRGAHNQFLEVLGENGVVGLALYLAFLTALYQAMRRVPVDAREPCLLVALAWLLHHFDYHNLVDFRNAALPVAYVCGLALPPIINSGRRAPG